MLSIFSCINLSLEKCLFKSFIFLFSNFFFTMLCWFLPYNNTKYTYVYLYIYIISIHTSLLPKPPFPPPISLLQVITGCQIGFPVLHSNFSTAIHLIHNSVYMLMLLSFLFLSLSFFFFFFAFPHSTTCGIPVYSAEIMPEPLKW